MGVLRIIGLPFYMMYWLIFSPHGRRAYSRKGFWGQTVHYDKYGNKTGETWRSFWGFRKRYDVNGQLMYYSVRNIWGGWNTYDPDGNLIRKSYPNFWKGWNTYDRNGKKTGVSLKNPWGGITDIVEDEIVSGKKTNSRKWTSVDETFSNSFVNSNVKEKEKKSTITEQTVTKKKNQETGKEDNIQSTKIEKDFRQDKNLNYVPKVINNVSFYDSVADACMDLNIPNNYVKVLIYRTNKDNVKECPGLAWRNEDRLFIKPLIKGQDSQAFVVDGKVSVTERKYNDLDMSVVDQAFYELSLSNIYQEFSDLYPEFVYGSNGIEMSFYEIDGIQITEKSVDEIKKL